MPIYPLFLRQQVQGAFAHSIHQKKKTFPLIPPHITIQSTTVLTEPLKRVIELPSWVSVPFIVAFIERMEKGTVSECPLQNSNYSSHPAFPLRIA